MLFHSLAFLLFFPIVFLIYYVTPKKYRYISLLIADLYFYASFSRKYVLLLTFTVFSTYLMARMVENDKGQGKGFRKIYLWIGIVSNLGILVFYKYLDFFLGNFNKLLSPLGREIPSPITELLLPVGISFYTFQALGYLIDVYKGQVECEKNILKYALFVSFFPTILSGPIERSKGLLRQIQSGTDFDYQQAKSGLVFMLWGFFEKCVVGDSIGIYVDEVFGNYTGYSSYHVWIAILMFTIQIYCDFGGYSHIAIGIAKILGFKLRENFHHPYLAVSIRDFWSRWHISLSTWFRDYVYIPLGGNRKGSVRRDCNLMITFLVSGLWHGAAWHYILWGGYHGMLQIIENHIRGKNTDYKNKIIQCCFGFLTFILVAFGWLFFRSSSLGEVIAMLRFGLEGRHWGYFPVDLGKFLHILLYILIIFIADCFAENGKSIFSYCEKMPVAVRWTIYVAVCLFMWIMMMRTLQNGSTGFIYLQF